jgi:SsrA-binding protein
MATKKPALPARIADNKKAAYNYFFEEKFEAGMVLQGWEVKAAREGKVQLTDGYVVVRDGELFVIGCQINPLHTASSHISPDAVRTKKLLMKKDDIKRLHRQGRTKRLHPGASESALEERQDQMRNCFSQG